MTDAAPSYMAVGRLGRPHGVRGELRLAVLTDFPDRFEAGARLFVGPATARELVPATVLSVRPQGDWLLVRFDVAPDRSAAAQLTNQFVYVPAAEARELPPDSYYPHQLVGLRVRTVDGRELGTVRELMETGAADVLIVSDGSRDHLIPMIGDVIDTVDLDAGCISITPMPGLLET